MLIYKITNLINNKVYIGLTLQKLSVRWSQHIYFSKFSNRKLYKAIRKYGHSNFTIESLDVSESIEELCVKEVYWINFYKATIDGYNNSSGGTYYQHSTDCKQLMSRLAKERILKNGHPFTGKKHSKETKETLSLIAKMRTKEQNPMFGKVHPNKGGTIIQPKTRCKYCNVEASAGNISRWHDEKCKVKICQTSS